ncbi:hypothetical protein Bxe_A0253 [Paraburkholderia xenovorans LB400]|uniref:Transposon Tn7 transposition protein TnsD C-terminal domain-containing protein n=1 Tax=Paraburkholderia xenovorans (strain LB400) TaxID=266265 RepID=Q13TA9_PARXL|nr:hypothetical protein Bxe_A0253 [Paraburkholderia xenovorans LB400]
MRLTRLPLLFSVSEREYLTCPECEEVQIRMNGFSYVHRRTGAPFVDVCGMHGCDLKPANGQMFLFDQGCRGRPTPYQRSMSGEFAKRVNESMEVPATVSAFRKEAVAEALHLAGWISNGGRLQLSSLLTEFTRFFSGAFSDLRLQFLVQSEPLVENALHNLLRDTRAVHPVWCILFAWFASACEMKKSAPRTERRQLRPEPSADELRVLMLKHGTVTKTAAALSLTTHRICTLCKRYGIDASWRPKFIDASMQKAIGDALARGELPKTVQVRFQVSISTVYRILASQKDGILPRRKATVARTEAAKARWLLARAEHPTLSATGLRKLVPPTWARLNRNAPDWLRENTGSLKVQKVYHRIVQHPQAVLRTFSESVRAAESACVGDEHPPLRKSLYRIRRELGVSEYAFVRGRLRLSMSSEGEPSQAFVARRVSWAIPRVCRRGKHNWAIARKARLRKETVNRYLGWHAQKG